MEIIKQELNTLAPNKEKAIDLFLTLVSRNQHDGSLKNVHEALEMCFVEGKVNELANVRQKLATNFISYCNLIFSTLQIEIIDKDTLSDAFRIVFNKKNIRYPNGFTNSFSESNNPNFELMLEPFSFCKVLLDLRNAYNHRKLGQNELTIFYQGGKNKKLSDKYFFQPDIDACLCTYLYVTEVYQVELQESFDKETEPNFTKYLQRIQRKFIHKFKKYVQIRTEEDLELTKNLKQRKTDFSENAPERIIGTVEELRNSKKIPQKRMILWADAGMGKSTTLEYLAYTDADKKLQKPDKKLPVFLELGLLTDKEMTLQQCIWQEINKDVAIAESYVVNALQNGKMNLFIDALNEIPKDLQTKRLREIDELCKNYPEAFIVISTRHSHNPFPNIPVFLLQKMNDEELETFLKKNTEGKPEDTKIIREGMEKEEFLKNAARQYFMFARLIELVAETKKLPDSAMNIVTIYLDAIYEREYTEKKDVRFSKSERKHTNYLLAELAYNIYMEYGEGNPVFSESQAMAHFRTCVKDNGFTIDLINLLKIVTELNILEIVVKEENNEKYRFFHGRYQEYFTTLYEKLHNY